MPAIDQEDLASRLRAIADETAEDRGLYIVDLQVRGQQGSRVIEVFAESDEGIKLDELGELSRDIGFLIESGDLVAGRYHLNVSSPGADRPLLSPRQYRRYMGRELAVTLASGDDSLTVTGALTSVGDDAFDLETHGQVVTIRFDDVLEARVQLPW